MNPIEPLLPLVFGILLIACPRLFFKRPCSEEELTKKEAAARKVGCVLLGVSALFFLLVVTGRR